MSCSLLACRQQAVVHVGVVPQPGEVIANHDAVAVAGVGTDLQPVGANAVVAAGWRVVAQPAQRQLVGARMVIGMVGADAVFAVEKIEEETARRAGVQRDGVDQRVAPGVADADARHHLKGLASFQLRREVVPFAVGGQAVRPLRAGAPLCADHPVDIQRVAGRGGVDARPAVGGERQQRFGVGDGAVPVDGVAVDPQQVAVRLQADRPQRPGRVAVAVKRHQSGVGIERGDLQPLFRRFIEPFLDFVDRRIDQVGKMFGGRHGALTEIVFQGTAISFCHSHTPHVAVIPHFSVPLISPFPSSLRSPYIVAPGALQRRTNGR
ncbi:hypothetical protein Dda3937_03070 [Dickeya dadantii 3937]|uniref:Uncharacterized protein n=1 Tax=Dickeya dadantii (strain 3937) TaxID=198628 RepID=E0SFB9_DICD3|nr:hypothetical protein Dda3937_03070 [Dickeya dadantii 3937]